MHIIKEGASVVGIAMDRDCVGCCESGFYVFTELRNTEDCTVKSEKQ